MAPGPPSFQRGGQHQGAGEQCGRGFSNGSLEDGAGTHGDSAAMERKATLAVVDHPSHLDPLRSPEK